MKIRRNVSDAEWATQQSYAPIRLLSTGDVSSSLFKPLGSSSAVTLESSLLPCLVTPPLQRWPQDCSRAEQSGGVHHEAFLRAADLDCPNRSCDPPWDREAGKEVPARWSSLQRVCMAGGRGIS